MPSNRPRVRGEEIPTQHHHHTMLYVLLALVAFVALGSYLRFVSSDPFVVDEWWHGVVTVSPGSAEYAVAVFLAQIGGGAGAMACTIIAASALLALRRPRDAAAVATAVVLGVAASELTKALVLRERPWDQLYESSGSSFPSGHTMGAAALAVSLALAIKDGDQLAPLFSKWVWPLSAAWMLLMAWSRTALHVHWLSDTLAGALLGACAAILARRIWLRPTHRNPSVSPPVNVRPTA